MCHDTQDLLPCRKKHGLDMASKSTRGLEMMHLFSGDFALEQPRPLPPKVKLVGALMASPAKPLPQDLDVSCQAQVKNSISLIIRLSSVRFADDCLAALPNV